MLPQIIRTSVRVCAGLLVMGSLAALPACARFPFKIDVQQGNYITSEGVARIKTGMPQAQVRSLLGAPLLIDGFHADRWDYIYLYTPGNSGDKIRRHVVVSFADGKVSNIDIRAMEPIPNEVPASAVPHAMDLDVPPAGEAK